MVTKKFEDVWDEAVKTVFKQKEVMREDDFIDLCKHAGEAKSPQTKCLVCEEKNLNTIQELVDHLLTHKDFKEAVLKDLYKRTQK